MNNGIRNGYEDIEEIVDPDGVVGLISRRRSNGALTIGLFKIFERDGVKEKTNFFSSRHIAAVRRILVIAEARMTKLEAGDDAPPGARAAPTTAAAAESAFEQQMRLLHAQAAMLMPDRAGRCV
jgi:hypothetical protein